LLGIGLTVVGGEVVELEVLGPNDVLKPVGEGVETRCVHVARARRPVNAIIIFSAS
jgi:hypothetical protein